MDTPRRSVLSLQCRLSFSKHGGNIEGLKNTFLLSFIKLLAALLTNYFIITIFNIKVRDKDESLIQSHPNVSSIVYGPETSDYHLNTFVDIECVHCYRPHFYGQPLEEVGLKSFTGLDFF